MGAMFPWPSRHQRKAAITQARSDRHAAEARAADAATLEAQIRRIAAENHFADTIARQIIMRHRGEGA
jgi:hypothetical protein